MTTVKQESDVLTRLLASAKRIGEFAEAERLQADLDSTISEKVVEVIRQEEVHKLIRPGAYGDVKVDYKQFVKFIETVGYYNLSAAWLTYFYSLHNAWVAFLPEHRQKEIYESNGLLADIFAPVGKVEDVEGGYILNGVYNFVSGINFSEWVAVGALGSTPDQKPYRMGLVVHRKDFKIEKDWDSLGLRGSGSNTIVIKDLFVPYDLTMNLSEIEQKRRPNSENYDKDYLYYHVPFHSAFFVGFAAMALGAAERAIHEFEKASAGRVRMNGEYELATPRNQKVTANLHLKLVTAKSLMDVYVAKLTDKEEQISAAQFKMIRSEVVQHCVDIGVKAVLTLGASALKKGHPVEMISRDLIAIGAHVTSLYEDALDSYGKYLTNQPTTVIG